MKKILLIVLLSGLSACAHEEKIDKKAYEKNNPNSWPFSSDEVTIGCDGMNHPYVIDSNGDYYGLTGYGQSLYGSLSKIHITGKSVSPFIEKSLEMCPRKN